MNDQEMLEEFDRDMQDLTKCTDQYSEGGFYTISCKLGLSRNQDKLPKIVTQPLSSGSTKGISLDLEENLKRYYEIRKWDWETGCPSEKKIKELEII